MSKFLPLAMLCAAIGGFVVQSAQAEPNGSANRYGARGERGAIGGQRGLVADGEGNVRAGGSAGFYTESGAQGRRTRSFERADDGSISASGQGSASGANGGSLERNGSYTRDADGNGSGQRSTTVQNKDGDSVEASTTRTKGEGASRSVTCTNSSGQSIDCPTR